jgi:hypothetical protein
VRKVHSQAVRRPICFPALRHISLGQCHRAVAGQTRRRGNRGKLDDGMSERGLAACRPRPIPARAVDARKPEQRLLRCSQGLLGQSQQSAAQLRFGARIGGGPDPRIGEKVCLQRLERGGDFLIEYG